MCCACDGGLVCADSNASAVDIGGDGCDWYVGMEEYCGWYDTPSFDAKEMCCACQGEHDTWNIEFMNLADVYCVDTDFGVGDTAGDGCEWYDSYPDWCGGFDTDEFIAGDMCCSC